MMAECTIFLKVDIQEWAYIRELQLSSSCDDGIYRMLRLDSELEFTGLINRQPFQCIVNCGTGSYTVPTDVIGCLMLNEELADEGVPANTSFDLTVSDVEFDDLKSCLMQSAGNSHTYVSVGLTLQGVQTEAAEKRHGKWLHGNEYRRIDGRSLEVTSFHWELQSSAVECENIAPHHSSRPLRNMLSKQEAHRCRH